jgi:hypothetical protein
MILMVDDTNYSNLEDNIKTTTQSEYPPSYLMLVCKNINGQNIVKSMMEYELNIPWKICNILDNEMTPSETIDMALDTNLMPDKYNLLAIFNNSNLLKTEFLESANDIINSFLEKQAVILPVEVSSFHQIMIPVSLYQTMHKKIGFVLEYLESNNNIYKFCIS